MFNQLIRTANEFREPSLNYNGITHVWKYFQYTRTSDFAFLMLSLSIYFCFAVNLFHNAHVFFSLK